MHTFKPYILKNASIWGKCDTWNEYWTWHTSTIMSRMVGKHWTNSMFLLITKLNLQTKITQQRKWNVSFECSTVDKATVCLTFGNWYCVWFHSSIKGLQLQGSKWWSNEITWVFVVPEKDHDCIILKLNPYCNFTTSLSSHIFEYCTELTLKWTILTWQLVLKYNR